MIIIEILENTGESVLFKSTKGLIRVSKSGFQSPEFIKNYQKGLIATDDSFWDTLERNGVKEYVC